MIFFVLSTILACFSHLHVFPMVTFQYCGITLGACSHCVLERSVRARNKIINLNYSGHSEIVCFFSSVFVALEIVCISKCNNFEHNISKVATLENNLNLSVVMFPAAPVPYSTLSSWPPSFRYVSLNLFEFVLSVLLKYMLATFSNQSALWHTI